MKRLHILPIALVLLACAAGTAAAAPSPTGFLKTIDEKLEPLLENTDENRDAILKIVNDMLDFPQLCRKSLGKHWGGRTKSQRRDFCITLKALIEKNFVNRLEESKGRTIEYQSEEVTGRNASVVTRVSPADPRAEKAEIEYKLKRTAKSWCVTDMVTDGVSLVNNYRSEFGKTIENDGWPVLMKKMKDKLAEREEDEKTSGP